MRQKLFGPLLLSIFGVFLSSCNNDVVFSTPSTTTQVASISIGDLGTYGFCIEDFDGAEDITLDIVVNSVNVNSLFIDEVDFKRSSIGNNIQDLFATYPVDVPREGLFTVQVTAIFTCSSCCGGNGPLGTLTDPDAVTCGSNGGIISAGQPRFSVVVPAMDAATLSSTLIRTFPIFRGCSTCGCID
jgi:hypothetical protein